MLVRSSLTRTCLATERLADSVPYVEPPPEVARLKPRFTHLDTGTCAALTLAYVPSFPVMRTARLTLLSSQFFYRHELLKPYRWYWRVEYVRVLKAWTSSAHLAYARPDVDFTCDIQYDPFVFMEQNNKTYGALRFLARTITLSHPRSGWTITLTEVMDTIPGLWEATKGK
jgi:alpha 1,2-mannosyltransferase